MFDIGFAELVLVGIVALIVVGPKDLPRMIRTVGQYAGMARQFQRAMDDAARDSDLDEVRDIGKTMKAAMDPLNSATNAARNYANGMAKDIADMDEPGQTPAPPSREEQARAANEAAANWTPPSPEPATTSDPAPAPEPEAAEPKAQ